MTILPENRRPEPSCSVESQTKPGPGSRLGWNEEAPEEGPSHLLGVWNGLPVQLEMLMWLRAATCLRIPSHGPLYLVMKPIPEGLLRRAEDSGLLGAEQASRGPPLRHKDLQAGLDTGAAETLQGRRDSFHLFGLRQCYKGVSGAGGGSPSPSTQTGHGPPAAALTLSLATALPGSPGIPASAPSLWLPGRWTRQAGWQAVSSSSSRCCHLSSCP